MKSVKIEGLHFKNSKKSIYLHNIKEIITINNSSFYNQYDSIIISGITQQLTMNFLKITEN